MMFQYVPYTVLYLVSTIIMVLLAWYVWKRRAEPGGFYFSMLLLAGGEWALAIALEMSAVSTLAEYVFHLLLYLGYMSVTPLWLLFSLEYGNVSKWLIYRRRMAVWVFPAIMILLAATNPWHGLVWSSVVQVSDQTGTHLVFNMGIGDWAIMGYSVLLSLIGTGIIFARAVRSSRSNLSVTLALMAGAVIPLCWGIIYVTDSGLFWGLDLTPFAFAFTGAVFSWGIFEHRLFDIKPVARETLLASMADGMLVLDSHHRILDINPAAYRMAGGKGAAKGQPTESALELWPILAPYCSDYQKRPEEIRLWGRGQEVWLEVCTSSLPDRLGRPAGWLITLRDVTERKCGEKALQQTYDEVIRSNEALQAEAAERQKAEGQILASLREKEVLLKEVHHRVKNNLQIISSLLSLQAGNVNRESATAFADSQNRIRSMALIHKQLYQSSDVSRVEFSEYVRSLTAHLTSSYLAGQNVRIEVDVEDVSLDLDTATPCGLIINELVSNSLKHAFPEGRRGAISVSLIKTGDLCRLAVADDGVGMPPGLDFQKTGSLGLQLVNVLVDQIEGTVELDSSATGTRFTVTFEAVRQKNEAGSPGSGAGRPA